MEGSEDKRQNIDAHMLANSHTHTHSHKHTDYPGLILPTKDRQIGSELIKCLPLTYAGAKQLSVCERKYFWVKNNPPSFVYLYRCGCTKCVLYNVYYPFLRCVCVSVLR